MRIEKFINFQDEPSKKIFFQKKKEALEFFKEY